MKNRCITWLILTIMTVMWTVANCYAHDQKGISTGQINYVPAYSHIYSGNKEVQSLLAVTLSIRNTDPNHPIQIVTVNYYDTTGKLLKEYVSSPLIIDALATKRYTISQRDKSGGSGANFIVEWKADKPVNVPIIESIMIGSRSSFTSRGQVIVPTD